MALYIDPPLNQDPIAGHKWTLPWYQYFQKIQAGIAAIVNGINQLTGDVTAGPGTGSQVATLANTAVTPGTYGDATHVARVTFDSKGRATAASDVVITGTGGHLHGLLRLLGDGATTTFNLLDYAEYLEHIGVGGSFQDPATFALSADRSQVVFAVAPGAGVVITAEYVIASP
jgi:hypothetical protein